MFAANANAIGFMFARETLGRNAEKENNEERKIPIRA
jgi:hypothetical protein